MKIDNALILKLEELSKLQLSEEERNSMRSNLSDMLRLVEKLNELPTEDVAPLIYINEGVNIWREDQAVQYISPEKGLQNAPEIQDDFFSVPRVIRLNTK
jgi:aspartyl-tRNA(Asn)/glutamyl-tRNA(Gln) amidotransferase subunit C